MTALSVYDRIAESAVNPGSGDILLAGAIDTTHAAFSSRFTNGQLVPVTVFGGSQWLTFVGTYNTGANSLTRTTLIDGSGGLAANVSFSSGTYTVMCAPLASNTALRDTAGLVTGTDGGLNFLAVRNPSAVATSEIIGIPSTADAIQLVFQNIIPATSADNFQIQYGTGGGPTYVTSGYADQNAGSPGFLFTNFGGTQVSVDTTTGISGSVIISGLQSNSGTLSLQASGIGSSFGGSGKMFPGTWSGAASPGGTPVTAFRIKFGTNNIASGRWWAYTLKKS